MLLSCWAGFSDAGRDKMRLRRIWLRLLVAVGLLLPALPGTGDAAAAAPRTKQRAEARAERKVSQPARRPVARPASRRPAVAARPPVRTLPLVVVDAGHGGADGGAVGAGGTLEKAVTLAAAQELARQLKATGRYRVLLTRDNDRFVPLAARAGLAVTHGAALMVSIHADASPNRQARGASVYVRPAQSSGPEVARLPASRGSSRAIARALSEPARPDQGSSRLQLAMVASLDDEVGMVPDPARQGRFRVLSSLGIPSVLVEMGFISNRRDEALLRQPRHRAVIARAIRDAVDDYFAGRGRPASRT